jgi:hypothetical protein
MSPDVFTLPFSVRHQDPGGIFAIEAKVVAWQEAGHEAASAETVTLTLGEGTLHDADKGVFPLNGLALTLRVDDRRFEPLEVLNPGVLSEFQQEALLDAVTNGLHALSSRVSPTPESDIP